MGYHTEVLSLIYVEERAARIPLLTEIPLIRYRLCIGN